VQEIFAVLVVLLRNILDGIINTLIVPEQTRGKEIFMEAPVRPMARQTSAKCR